jgi:hypothetical protein
MPRLCILSAIMGALKMLVPPLQQVDLPIVGESAENFCTTIHFIPTYTCRAFQLKFGSTNAIKLID